jgi:hypothetical protein
MGLFSSSYKYYAYAGSSTMLPAEEREHTVKSLMLQAGISNLSTMAEAIKMGLQTDLYRRAYKMAKYAADPDGYPYGFPSTITTIYYFYGEDLEPILEAELGFGIDISAYYLDYPNNYVWMWIEQGIHDNYESWFTGDPPIENWYYYPEETQIPVENPDTLEYYLANNKNYDAVIAGDNCTVTFHYLDNLGDPQTWTAPTFSLGLPPNNDSQWIMVRYRVTGEPSNFDYWFYEIGSDLIPEIESEIQQLQFESEYLPIAILMHDRVWFDEQGDPVLEEGLDKLLKYIALDPYDIKEDFIDSIENPDPETPPDQIPAMEDIWDFFVHFSMPMRTTDRAAREYLWRFYKELMLQTWTSFDQYNSWVVSRSGPQPQSNFSVEEGEEYTGYIARYAWSYIAEATHSGTYTPPGWDRPLKTRECWSEEYALGDPDYNVGLDLVHGAGNYNVASGTAEGEEHAYTVVVRQNSLTEGGGSPTYTAVLMMGPSMEYQINTSDVPVGVGSGGYVDYRYRFVDVEIFPEDPEENSEFRWPIRVGVLKDMSAMRREPALQEALAATVFLVDRVKVKWYQTGFFKWLIIIIVIIVVILTYQYQLLGTVSSLASTAFAAGATATAIAYAALYVAMTFALGFLISFAGSLLGGTWGQMFVLLATLYLAGGTSFLTNIGSTWNTMVSSLGWGNAAAFLQSIGPVISVARTIVENRALAKLESQMRDFTKTAREKYEELQDAWDEFGGKPGWLDPMDLVGAFQAQWYVEMPDNYFRRTLNANPGVLGYDMVDRFADMALVLPVDGNPTEFMHNMFVQMERQRGAV